MVRKAVKSSSTIAAHEYDAAKKTLTVTFKSGATYDYSDVPEATAALFARAPSKGKFLHTRIKGHFPYSKRGG